MKNSILAMLSEDKIIPKRVASTKGGEYASPCPRCGGKDRFRIWPEENRWFCRGCNKSGDAIEYLRHIRGLSFTDACRELGETKIFVKPQMRAIANVKPSWKPKSDKPIINTWQEKAKGFVLWAHKQLLKNKSMLAWLEEKRGLSIETVKMAKLGWNLQTFYRDRKLWGLEQELNDKGTLKKLWFPAGLIIPTWNGETILRIRIRRPDEDLKKSDSRYVIISGSSNKPMILGNKPGIVIVESELDGVLLAQEVGEIAGVIALGSSVNRPDEETAKMLWVANILLVSLDSDEAGAKESWGFWKRNFPNFKRWPIPKKFGKDHTEAFFAGVDLKKWVELGLKNGLRSALDV